MSLGTNISRLRAEQHLSQGDLAEALDVSRQSVSKWETDASVPDLDKLVKLSQVFGVTLDELVTGEAPAAPEKPAVPAATQPRRPVQTSLGLVFLLLWLLMELALLLRAPSLQVLWMGLRLYAALLLCGLFCLFLRRRTAFWCGWVLYLGFDYYWRLNGLFSWKLIFRTIGFDPIENNTRLAISWGLFVGMTVMLAWTLFTFRNAKVPPFFQKQRRLALCWLLYLAVSIPVFVFQSICTARYTYTPFYNIYVDWPLLVLLATLLTVTVSVIRSLKRNSQGTP